MVLKRQLALHRKLKARGQIDHDHLFFNRDGTPIRRLGHVAKCWCKSLMRLGMRLRRPYCARHASVSWNLMIGKKPLFVARQHGYSPTTMFRIYAAWMDGAPESDIELIEASMGTAASLVERTSSNQRSIDPVATLGTGLATGEWASGAEVPKKKRRKKWRRGWDSN